MPVPREPPKEFSLVESEAEVDTYVKELLKIPENRSMEVAYKYAEQITNRSWRLRFINKWKEMLDECEKTAKGQSSKK